MQGGRVVAPVHVSQACMTVQSREDRYRIIPFSERGKPDCPPPLNSRHRAGERRQTGRQRPATNRRVKDVGESEGPW